MLASVTTLPVIGVPVALSQLDGLDSLLSIVQMPKGVPVATMAVNGARNAGLLAVRILAQADAELTARMEAFQEEIASDARAQDAVVSDGGGCHGGGPRWLSRTWPSGSATAATAKLVIVNADDLGSCHSANVGVYECLATGTVTSATLMVPCPWAREASSRYRGEDIGVHLTVNAEYELYRWGPITHARRCWAATAASRGRSRTSGTMPTSTRSAASAGHRLSGPSCGASTSATSMRTWARCSYGPSSSTSTWSWRSSSGCPCAW